MLKSQSPSLLVLHSSINEVITSDPLQPRVHQAPGQVNSKPRCNKRYYSESSSPNLKSLAPRKYLKPNENSKNFYQNEMNKKPTNNSVLENVSEQKNSEQNQLTQPAMKLTELPSQQEDETQGNEGQAENCQEQPKSNDLLIAEDEIFLVEYPEKTTTEVGLLDTLINSNERVLILDLDNTLIHSTIGVLTQEERERIESIRSISLIPTQSTDQFLIIKRREFLEQFLKLAFENFKVVMYTLGSITYATAVLEIFKQAMPNIFSKYSFLRIIAQSSNRSPSIPQNVSKDISRYFSFSKFSTRLLVVDDNQNVYSEEWQNNVIFTKPYRFWIQGADVTAALNKFSQTNEDCFLFFAHRLLQVLLLTELAKESIVHSYLLLQSKLLNGEVVRVSPAVNQFVNQTCLNLGATPFDQSSLMLPTTIIVTDQEYHKFSVGNCNQNFVTENWLTYSYLFALNIPKSIWYQVEKLPNLETALVKLLQ